MSLFKATTLAGVRSGSLIFPSGVRCSGSGATCGRRCSRQRRSYSSFVFDAQVLACASWYFCASSSTVKRRPVIVFALPLAARMSLSRSVAKPRASSGVRSWIKPNRTAGNPSFRMTYFTSARPTSKPKPRRDSMPPPSMMKYLFLDASRIRFRTDRVIFGTCRRLLFFSTLLPLLVVRFSYVSRTIPRPITAGKARKGAVSRDRWIEVKSTICRCLPELSG